MRYCIVLVAVLMFAQLGCSTDQNRTDKVEPASKADADNAVVKKVTPEELLNWRFLGSGEIRIAELPEAVFMQESANSQGITLVSNDRYGDDIVVTYQVKPMTYESVCVFIMSASDKNTGGDITIPDDYDGNFPFWTQQDIQNYTFAFHNGAHDRKPFVIRNPGMKVLFESDKHFAREVWHDIEIGRRAGEVWLTIDGESVFHITDSDPDNLPGGRIGFRLRGTPDHQAAMQLKNVVITTK